MPMSLLVMKPLFMPFFTVKSRVVSSLPSSIPVMRLRSLFSSYTLMLSMMEVGRFFMAVWVSPVMNSLPPTFTFFTCLPLMVILPSSSIWAPGMRFTSSSATEPSGTR